MSISYAKDLYVVDLDCQTCDSPTDTMSFSAISSPTASVVDFNNIPAPSSSSIPSMLSDFDHPSSDLITLDSFIPILQHLSGFHLDQNYTIRGSITEDDWAGLRDYTRTVSKFILTDKNFEARISPAVFLRLARLQHPNMPLLPSLSDLVIADADASIAYLDLLLTPSLKSLKASCVPDAQQSTFFSFLTAINEEAPLLQTLSLGPGRFLSSSLQTIHQFNNLRHLDMKHEDSELPFAFDEIGSLPKLETLILDARNVSSARISKESSVPPAFKDIDSLPSDSFPNSNVMDGKQNEDTTSESRGQSRRTPIPPVDTFNQLVKLHIIGRLPVLEDLIPRITSTKLEDVSITFIRLSFDELKIQLAKEKTEQEIKDEVTRRKELVEKSLKEKEKLWRDEMERKWIDEERRLGEEQKEADEAEAEATQKEEEQNRSIFASPLPSHPQVSSLWSHPYDAFSRPACVSPSPTEKSQMARANSPPRWGSDDHFGKAPTPQSDSDRPQITPTYSKKGGKNHKKLKKQERREAQDISLMEQEWPASLCFESHTVSFTERVLRRLCHQWSTSLQSISIYQLDASFRFLSEPPTIPEELFRKMLLLPVIENLEVKGWILDHVESVLSAAEPIPRLKSLLLPLGETNFGISLPTLRHVAKACPKLESFQCYIQSLNSVPEYPVPTNVGLSHGLRKLSVGNSLPTPETKQLYLIARHLYLLFPNLHTISTSKGHNSEQWATIDEFVKMFQIARLDDLNRQLQ